MNRIECMERAERAIMTLSAMTLPGANLTVERVTLLQAEAITSVLIAIEQRLGAIEQELARMNAE